MCRNCLIGMYLGNSFCSCSCCVVVSPTSNQIYLSIFRGINEVMLHSTMILFPICCLSTESFTALLICAFTVFLFLVGPLICYYSGTWPAADEGWTAYFRLFQQYAPCLVYPYMIARYFYNIQCSTSNPFSTFNPFRAIQGVLRRTFSRQPLCYLMYLDALTPTEEVEESENGRGSGKIN